MIKKIFFPLFAILTPLSALAEEIRFVSCPIYRDTDVGKKSGCWLSEDPATGKVYDLGYAINYPDYRKGILVEGNVTRIEANICGGVVLRAVRVSILSDIECSPTIIPPENFPGRRFVLPARYISTTYGTQREPNIPIGPTTFYTFYELDRSFLIYSYDDYFVEQAALWLRRANPKTIEITGYADTQGSVVSGHLIKESREIALERAQGVATSLERLGVNPSLIKIKTNYRPRPISVQEVDGLVAPSLRRVEIKAIF